MADLDEKQQAVLNAVWESAALLQGLRNIESMATDRFMGAVQDARKAGVPLGTIAQSVGLSASRLTQMITSRKRSRSTGPARHLGEITATPPVASREDGGPRKIA